jgi:hypothetical protein
LIIKFLEKYCKSKIFKNTQSLKVIISHDVDHIYPSDHIFKDLIFPKLWVRSIIELVQGKISFQTCYYRLISIFAKRLNRIPEIIEFDRKYNIPSTFFFGMDNLHGMSYKKSTAAPWIKFVLEKGFDAGVHGVEFENINKMQNEFNDFQAISNLSSFGIRIHYIRYKDNTFNKMADIGYFFDTSEFNKREIELKPSYKIGNMWEFPLHIMDGYVMKDKLETAKEQTIETLDKAINKGLEYFTFLFHDYMFNEKTYPEQKAYYEWFVDYCISQNLEFISYREAIDELERNSKQHEG